MVSRDVEIKKIVKERYSDIARSGDPCCSLGCCGEPTSPFHIVDMGQKVGYTKQQLGIGLAEANLGLGCGNPSAIADIQFGEQVVDLGCGAGFDAFLAARSVGPDGFVIGIDMTPEMINRAEENARKLNVENVEFRLGEIERLPVESNSVDVVLSNCVINLSPDKQTVYGEIFRILKRGGRISISDVLRSGDIPTEIRDDPSAYTGWIAGAISPDEVRHILDSLGFEEISITRKENSEDIIRSWNFKRGTENIVFSAYVTARKPDG